MRGCFAALLAVVNATLKDLPPFVRKALAAEAITPVCEPKAE